MNKYVNDLYIVFEIYLVNIPVMFVVVMGVLKRWGPVLGSPLPWASAHGLTNFAVFSSSISIPTPSSVRFLRHKLYRKDERPALYQSWMALENHRHGIPV